MKRNFKINEKNGNIAKIVEGRIYTLYRTPEYLAFSKNNIFFINKNLNIFIIYIFYFFFIRNR